MKPIELRIARIGNSRGVRIPAATLERYDLAESVIMEERSDGILLRSPGPATPKLSIEATAREMANEAEDWSAWDVAVGDGVESTPWESALPRRAAKKKEVFRAPRRSRRR